VDPADDDRVRGDAGADRRHGLLPARAPARRAPRSAKLDSGAEAAVGGRDDRGSINNFAGGLAWREPGRAPAVGLLVIGSVASLAANVAAAEPTATGRVIAAWPSFALIASYELLMRQVRRVADGGVSDQSKSWLHIRPHRAPLNDHAGIKRPSARRGSAGRGREAQVVAWQWAMANRSGGGSLPSGKDIGQHHGRHERWGRLVKRSGLAGELDLQI
jgi:hypothetical protein